MKRVFIGLGSNQGDSLKIFNEILKIILSLRSIFAKVEMSPVVLSAPIDGRQYPYFNAAITFYTSLKPLTLLDLCENLEIGYGRELKNTGRPRAIDIDILLYEDLDITSDRLTIPHPRAYQREFVLYPLYTLDNTLVLPGYGKIETLLYREDVLIGNIIRRIS